MSADAVSGSSQYEEGGFRSVCAAQFGSENYQIQVAFVVTSSNIRPQPPLSCHKYNKKTRKRHEVTT